jgi:hypothetical protein
MFLPVAVPGTEGYDLIAKSLAALNLRGTPRTTEEATALPPRVYILCPDGETPDIRGVYASQDALRQASHVTPLEAAAYDVIDDVLDVLQQAEDKAASAADVDEARLSLDRHLATFNALAVAARATKGDNEMSAVLLAALAGA